MFMPNDKIIYQYKYIYICKDKFSQCVWDILISENKIAFKSIFNGT